MSKFYARAIGNHFSVDVDENRGGDQFSMATGTPIFRTRLNTSLTLITGRIK